MIRDIIIEKHQNDQDQIDFIFSEADHISVIAPAGCGKTTAMVSKIAYELGTNHIPQNKKILAMTYSVAAALKIREAVKTLLPDMVKDVDTCISKIEIANYHRFAVQIIRKYGYSIDMNFVQFQEFSIVDDNTFCRKFALEGKHRDTVTNFTEVLKTSDSVNIDTEISEYWNAISSGLQDHIITYNGILIAAIRLLQNSNIRHFYTSLYKIVIVDEFQDTNILGFMLVQLLIDRNRSIFLGDNLQKIYGFIGALPNAFSMLRSDQSITEFTFSHNYRFSDCEMMKSLDLYLRRCYEQFPSNAEEASVYFEFSPSQTKEIDYITASISSKLDDENSTIAILVRAGYQGKPIAQKLSDLGIPYFNALYKDTDPEFISFYATAQEEFEKATHRNQRITKRGLNSCLAAVHSRKAEICKDPKQEYIFDSLFTLLSILFSRSREWLPDERYININYTLGSKALKHMMEYLDERIVLTTIHSAKGLEWDYVYVSGLMAYSFPPTAFCKLCTSCLVGTDFCSFHFNPQMKAEYQDELSVFYVALTRAKKMVYLSANSGPNASGYSQRRSCLTCLPGLKLIKIRENGG